MVGLGGAGNLHCVPVAVGAAVAAGVALVALDFPVAGGLRAMLGKTPKVDQRRQIGLDYYYYLLASNSEPFNNMSERPAFFFTVDG